MRNVFAALLAGLSLQVGGCALDAQGSDSPAVEFAACDTFLEHCDELTSFRVTAPELQRVATAPIGERVRFDNLLPNHLVRFEIEGLRGERVLYHARCEVAALDATVTEAICHEQLARGPML